MQWGCKIHCLVNPWHMTFIKKTPFVQVIHNGWYHWLAFTTYGYQHREIFVLDSKFEYSLLVQTKLQICALMYCHKKFITVAVIPVQQQTGCVDCGLFAITFIQYILAEKKNPIDVSFSQSSMRNHALKCLKNDNLEMFPQSKDSLIKRSKEKVIQLAIHCICWQIWVEPDIDIFER